MKLRVHDDGRWALLAAPGHACPWAVLDGTENFLAVDDDWFGPGWHDAIVLPVDDTGARRLAEAMWGWSELRQTVAALLQARAVLDRLAEGGERDG
jgi:hypothetical protein